MIGTQNTADKVEDHKNMEISKKENDDYVGEEEQEDDHEEKTDDENLDKNPDMDLARTKKKHKNMNISKEENDDGEEEQKINKLISNILA